MDPDRHIADLEAQLAALGDAHTHARGVTEFLLGMAIAEHPGADAASHRRAIGHYAEALRVFDARRFPLERARTYIALGASERTLGMGAIARERFDTARDLLAADPGPDLGAAENNLGLVLEESGDTDGAIGAYRRAVEVFASLAAARQEASAQENLGRVLAASEDVAGAGVALRRAVELTAAVDDGPLWAAHVHALAVHLIDHGDAEEAANLLDSTLTVFTRPHHPFQHAMAKYNLGFARLALADRGGGPEEVRLALAAFEDAAAVFDPRLHADEWRAVEAGIAHAGARLGADIDRTAEFVALLTNLDPDRRRRLLFERLDRLWSTPEPARTGLVRALDEALVSAPGEAGVDLARDWMRFLTEHSFDNAAFALSIRTETLEQLEGDARRQATAGVEAAIGELEVLIRVQVRGLLEAAGYQRPDGLA
jgi:tetratricopeptide (TPR) repeat protein